MFAIAKVRVWDGCKAFIEFSKKFYPAAVAFEITPETAGQKLYYDASYGQRGCDAPPLPLTLLPLKTKEERREEGGNTELYEYFSIIRASNKS
ncbi:MAG: hypothetical protein AAGD25_26010 [Cyanobacteria bacterium P01_F01_bin.150]